MSKPIKCGHCGSSEISNLTPDVVTDVTKSETKGMYDCRVCGAIFTDSAWHYDPNADYRSLQERMMSDVKKNPPVMMTIREVESLFSMAAIQVLDIRDVEKLLRRYNELSEDPSTLETLRRTL